MSIYLQNINWKTGQNTPSIYPRQPILAKTQNTNSIKYIKAPKLPLKINFSSNLDLSPTSTLDKVISCFFKFFSNTAADWVAEASFASKKFLSLTFSKISSLKPIFINAANQPLKASFWKCLAAACMTATIAAAILITCPPLAIFPLVETAVWLFCTAAIMFLNHLAQHSDASAAKTIRWLHATVMDINCSIASALLFPATLVPSYHEAKGNLNGRPILMIHGYLGYGSTWHVLRERLANAGCGPIYTMNIGSFQSIAEYATYVQTQVKKIQNETGRKDIIFICHSKGGLVGSYYATQLAPSDGTKVTDIVTIASPLAGTPAAKYALGQDAKEMNPEHPFHADLRKEIANHPEIRFFNIASETDTVVPLQSALLGTNPSRQKVFNDLGRVGLVYSSRSANQILAWLQV